MNPRQTGRVKWFNDEKGFGFIERSPGDDLFVHKNSINEQFRRGLHENDKVEFNAVQGQKGWQAENVTIVENE